MFSCVAANHLGLVDAIENTIRHKLPIINCSKCLTFWTLIVYGVSVRENIFVSIATSFLFAYFSVWLLLLFAIIDKQYNRIYDKIYTTADTTSYGTEYSEGTMPGVQSEGEEERGSSAY